jgi:flagellar biosynthesis protein FlhG
MLAAPGAVLADLADTLPMEHPTRTPSGKPLKTLAICSGKGGVGKTNVSVNLAVALAAMGRQVMLLDADLAMANVNVMLGVRSRMHLGHVLDGEVGLEDIIYTGPEGVLLVPASSGVSRLASLSTMECAGLIGAFSALNRALDAFIVDVAAGVGESVVMFTRAVQDVVVVICDEPASLADAYALIKVLSVEHRVTRFHVLANMVSTPEHGRALFAKLANVCRKYLEVRLSYMGAVPQDEYLRKAVRQQKPVVVSYPGSPSGRAFYKLAQYVDALERPAGQAGGVEFFIERIVAGDAGIG